MTSILGQPLDIGGATIRNRVFLAPLSGITDEAFRKRAHLHGAGLVVSEMVASGELAKGSSESIRRMRRPDIDLHVVQLAGREPGPMAEAARIAAGEGADIIDINMGCPAKKVTGGYSGSALMRDLDHALTLIDATVGAVDVPVTVKMRLGWDEATLNAPSLAQRAEQAGVSMITVHGRTRCQFYQGKADWRGIRRVKESVSIPVVANGDVTSLEDSLQILDQSGADAVMIGRGHCGSPWTAASIVAEAAGAVASGVPRTSTEIADYVAAHYQDMLSLYGVESGLRQARKHLGWYLEKHAPDVAEASRKLIMTSLMPAEVIATLRQVFIDADHRVARQAA